MEQWALEKAGHPDDAEAPDDSSQADEAGDAADKAEEEREKARDEAEARAAAQEAVKDPDVQEILKAGVRRRGPGRVEVDVSVLQTVAQDTDVLVGSTRVSTATRAGKTIGLTLEDVGPGTLLAHLGFRSGDIITKVAGANVTTSNDARQALNALRDVQHVTVEFIRRGKPQKLDIGLTLTPPSH
jgi:type II secretory pathway component PulC